MYPKNKIMAVKEYIMMLMSFLIVLPTGLAMHGVVYDILSNPVPFAIVSVYSDGALISRSLAGANGSYYFPLSNGTYQLVAMKYGTDLYYNETIRVEGDQKMDVVMYEKLPYENLGNITIPSGELQDENLFNSSPPGVDIVRYASGILVMLAGILLVVSSRKKAKLKDKDIDLVLGIIKSNKGKIKQKDIVTKTGFSEAKVSLILKELKRKGIIRKKKVGREKIIYLQ